MIDQVSAGRGPVVAPNTQSDLTRASAARTEKASIPTDKQPEKPDALKEDIVKLSPTAQARALRREGQSIPQIAIKLGLSIPAVDAFFTE